MSKYLIKRIEPNDNVADITMGLALVIPEYNYDILFGFTYQKSGAETFRICKYDPYIERIKPKANIDFAKADNKLEILIRIVEALEEMVATCGSIDDIQSTKVEQFRDSSLNVGKSSNIVYSVCYYEDIRHIGFCIRKDERDDVYLRFFRVDTTPGDTYPESFRKEYYAEHRWFSILLEGLDYITLTKAFVDLIYEIIGLLEEEETYFYDFPKYKE